MTFSCFQQDHGCTTCYNEDRTPTIEYMKEEATKRKYKLISDTYYTAKTKYIFECIRGHKFEMQWNNFKSEQNCPICNMNGTSIPEKEILEYVSSLYKGKILPRDRKTIKNPLTKNWLELDIYLPDIKKAIETGSLFYHGDEYTKSKDKIKQELCCLKGISLLSIVYEKKWKKEKVNVFNKIQWFLNK